MFSYFSIRLNSLLNSFSFEVCNKSFTIPNIRWMRSANKLISLRACIMESSEVESKPPVMKRKRYSSSCSFCGIILHTVFSISFTNQIKRSTLQILNAVWKAESLNDTATAGSVDCITSVTNHEIAMVNGLNRQSTQITPNTLNTKCAKAARLAGTLPVKAAKLAVMVVPIFSPNTKAAPNSKLIQPLAHIMSVMAIVAADACTIIVRIVPISTNRITEAKPMSV